MLIVHAHESVFCRQSNKQIILLAVFTGILITVLFMLQSHIGFNIADEGYLWYGAQRVLKGEVPVRDFMAYDPGRYYWSASFMRLLGNNGLVTLRIGEAVFQALGLFLGLFILVRYQQQKNGIFLLLVASTLLVWMFSPFKVFDTSVAVALVAIFTYLAEQPSVRRYFWTGVVVGLSSFFGRNHGLYGGLGSVGLIIYLTFKKNDISVFTAFAYWLTGVFLGFLPILGMLAIVPGFFAAFWESIRFLFEINATNLPLPVPWPWRVPFGQISWVESLRYVFVGFFFIAIVVYPLASLVYLLQAKIKHIPTSSSPLFVATAFTALPYVHYAFSRADVSHLSLGIFPFLIGVFALLSDRPKIIKLLLSLFLFSVSLFVLLPMYPLWQLIHYKNWIETEVGEDKIKVDPVTANNLVMLKKLAKAYSPGERSFLTTPFWPGAYAVLERKSPIWEIYALFPRSNAFQAAEIKRIQHANPGFVLVLDAQLDGRDDLRYQNTHPLINQYIRDNFVPVNSLTLDSDYHIYKNKQGNP
jgi:hypothetical protein